MKKILCILLTALTLFALLAPGALAAAKDTDTSRTEEVFTITSGGKAKAIACYYGKTGTTSAAITIKLQKKFLLFFWSDVDGAEWTDYKSGQNNSTSHEFQLSSTGSYRAVYTYDLYGTGTTDHIEKTAEASY